MTLAESSRSIDEAASDWTARLDRGPLTPKEENGLEAWLNGDPRRRGALLRAQALSMMSESAQALGPTFDPVAFAAPTREPVRKPGMSRRHALAWAGSAAACASLVAMGVGISAAGAVVRTGRGELRLVPLKDGSTVMLNTNTSIRIDVGGEGRHVALIEGEAYFSVTRDGAHPFVVDVSGRKLRTAQANFRVRKLDNAPVDILVHQGRVEFAALSRKARRPVAVDSNMRVVLADAGFLRQAPPERPTPVPPERVTRDLAWLQGKIAFEGETLEQAANSFARYSDTHIRIRDPGLGREPVTGLFAANDPLGFSRAVASAFDAKMEQAGDTIVLSRNAAAQ